MQVVPLIPQPSITLQVVLDGQQCQIAIYSKTGYEYSDTPGFTVPNTNLYFDLIAGGVPITNTAICLDGHRLLINRQYLGFVGDFVFIDTQGNDDPQWQGLGARFVLLYLEADDITELEAEIAA